MRAWRQSLVAGLFVVLLAMLSGVVHQPVPCGGLPARYPPVIAFELARTPADLALIFGAAPSGCQRELIAAMNLANWADLLLFMPAYGAFLVLFFGGFRDRRSRLAAAGMALAGLAVMADVAENVCMFRIADDLQRAPEWLGRLVIATSLKWVALGVVGALAAWLLLSFGWVAKVGAGLAAIALPAALAMLDDPARWGPPLTLHIGLSWFVILIFVGTRRANPDLSSSPG